MYKRSQQGSPKTDGPASTQTQPGNKDYCTVLECYCYTKPLIALYILCT